MALGYFSACLTTHTVMCSTVYASPLTFSPLSLSHPLSPLSPLIEKGVAYMVYATPLTFSLLTLSPLVLPEVVFEVENIVFNSFRLHQHVHTLYIIVDFTVVYV